MSKFTVMLEERYYTVVEAENAEQAKAKLLEDLELDEEEQEVLWANQTQSLEVIENDNDFIRDFELLSKELEEEG